MSDLQVRRWPVDKLIPYARNARTHSDEQMAQVAASIAEFGWTNPILAGADGIIIAGHARLLAARKLGMTEVPVIVLDHLTEAQRRALVLLAQPSPRKWPQLRYSRRRPVQPCPRNLLRRKRLTVHRTGTTKMKKMRGRPKPATGSTLTGCTLLTKRIQLCASFWTILPADSATGTRRRSIPC